MTNFVLGQNILSGLDFAKETGGFQSTRLVFPVTADISLFICLSVSCKCSGRRLFNQIKIMITVSLLEDCGREGLLRHA